MAVTPVHVLAIDQGTTSTRAIVFDRDGLPVATAQRELRQFYPHDGWVEHDLDAPQDALTAHVVGKLTTCWGQMLALESVVDESDIPMATPPNKKPEKP